MELDSHLLGLNIAAEQQHSIISHWESRNNRVYGKTQDSSAHRPGTNYQVDEADDVGERRGSCTHKSLARSFEELNSQKFTNHQFAIIRNKVENICPLVDDLIEDDLEDDVTVQQAWSELTEITKEQERYAEMRAAAEKELEACRKRSAALEDVRAFRL